MEGGVWSSHSVAMDVCTHPNTYGTQTPTAPKHLRHPHVYTGTPRMYTCARVCMHACACVRACVDACMHACAVHAQTLLHWAYELSAVDFVAGAERVKKHGATYVPRDQLIGIVKPHNVAPHDQTKPPAALAPTIACAVHRGVRRVRQCAGKGTMSKAQRG